MFKIAVCDDEEPICSHLETILLDYGKESNQQLEIEIFYSGEDLYKALRLNTRFDLIFLDIELKGLNGIKIGKIIRDELYDEITQIVYISSKQEYAMELFENRPLNFLLKDSSSSEIIRVLEKGINLINSQNNFFEFIYNRNFCKLSYKDIIYFESDNKKINLVTNSEIYNFYGKISTIISNLHSMDFIQIHKSYVINYLYLTEVQTDAVIMSTGIKLPISQTFKKQFRNKLLKRRRGNLR